MTEFYGLHFLFFFILLLMRKLCQLIEATTMAAMPQFKGLPLGFDPHKKKNDKEKVLLAKHFRLKDVLNRYESLIRGNDVTD
jgi:hypothetical protein